MGILNFWSASSGFNIWILGLVFTVYGFLEVESSEENVVHVSQPPLPTTPQPPVMFPPPLSHGVGNAPPPPPPSTLNVGSLRRPPPRSRSRPRPARSKSQAPPISARRRPPPRSPSQETRGTANKSTPPSRRKSPAGTRGHDAGKIVGLVFAGFAAMLQVCVVVFLVFKRKQLLR